MADSAKTAAKTEGGFNFEDMFLWFIAITILLVIFIPNFSYKKVPDYIDNVLNEKVDERGVKKPSVLEQVKFKASDLLIQIYTFLIIIGLFFWILFIMIKKYFENKLATVKKDYIKKLKEQDELYIKGVAETQAENTLQQKWSIIQNKFANGVNSDLRIAIIEADILLYEALKLAGFNVGNSIGEILKSLDVSKLRTLQEAWKAHKVRNEIAHQGSDFILTKSEADNTMISYKRVFEELWELIK